MSNFRLSVEICEDSCEKKDANASGMGVCTAGRAWAAVVVETEGGEEIDTSIMASSNEFEGGPTEMSVRGSVRA